MIYREQNAQRALSPTAITIADYVINPFVGCDFNCVYCYAKLNSTYQKKRNKVGDDFVEAKANIIPLLKKELREKNPRHVLIGSTTDGYQHCEATTAVMRDILELLNNNDITYTILTKSHRIERDLDLIGKNPHNEVYFTVNSLNEHARLLLEPMASSIAERKKAIQAFHGNGIKVVLHAGPVIPGITEARSLMDEFMGMCSMIEFESLNLIMVDKVALMTRLKVHFPEAFTEVQLLYGSKQSYEYYYNAMQEEVIKIAAQNHIKARFFIYPYNSFYSNQLAY